MTSDRRVLVVGEHDGETLSSRSRRLIASAARLVGTGGAIDLAILGNDLGQLRSRIHGVPVDRILLMDAPELEIPNGEAEVCALVEAADRAAPSVILFAHDQRSLEVAPQLATRLGGQAISNCVSVSWDNFRLELARPIFGGTYIVEAEVVDLPAVITVSSAAQIPIATTRSEPLRAPEVVHVDVVVGGLRTTVVETIRAPIPDVDIADASVVVGVGRGISERAVFELALRVAERLDAEIACSRPILDRGWLNAERLVGLSGRSIAPRVYLAFGISGAAQHTAGISGGTCVIAVNSDAAAPIFRIADYAVVQDAALILSALVAKTSTEARV